MSTNRYRSCKLCPYSFTILCLNDLMTIVFRQLVAQTLRPFVYDSPLERPMFKNIRYLIPIFNAVQEHLRLEQALRELRTQFQEAIKQPMVCELFRFVGCCLFINCFNSKGEGYPLAL